MIRVFEAFSGVGSQRMALRNIGIDHEVVAISDIDKYALASYKAIFGDCPNLGDISKIDVKDIPDHDLFTYSFPCFVAGTLVLTSDGFKKIENIGIDDVVLTHKNRYGKVLKTMEHETNHLYELKTMNSHKIETTEEHPFYVRERYREWNNGKRTDERKFREPGWIKACNLTKKYYVGTAINANSKLPEWNGCGFKWNDGRKSRHSNLLKDKFNNNDFWWLIGRYIGDGWIRTQGGIIICCAEKETEDITEKIKSVGLSYNIAGERTVNKIHIPIKELSEYVLQFGKGASNKRITSDIIDLPIELLKSFIVGYESADGCVVGKTHKITSVSKELIYGVSYCITKAYKRPVSIYKTIRKNKYLIENRIVNQKNTFSLNYKLETNKQDKAFYEDGYIWYPINKITQTVCKTMVYNLEVESDNSYTVNGTIVHNCQDISLAGLQRGLDKGNSTRSSLLWECERIIREKKPSYLLLENVKNLVGEKHFKNFDKWLHVLAEIGYVNYWQVLNAKDYGIPQNRERVFVVSIRKDVNSKRKAYQTGFIHNDTYLFPPKQELKLKLKDLLEDVVDEKYYLSDKMLSFMKSNSIKNEEAGNGFRFKPTDGDNVACAVTTHAGSRMDDNFIVCDGDKFNNAVRVGGIFDGETTHQAGSIYDQEGIAPTIDTREGGWRQPLIRVNNATQKGYEEAYEGDGIILDQPQSKTKRGRVQSQSSPTVMTSGQIGVVEPFIVASRGRDKNNPNDRSSGNPDLEQRLEPNKAGLCNTITSFQKDNYVVERFFRQAQETLEENDCEVGDTINAFNKTVDRSGCSPTITTRPEGFKTAILPVVETIWGSQQEHCAVRNDGICTTLTEAMGMGGGQIPLHNYGLRIRKLTVKEVWRLMGFTDEDFYKAARVNSNSQLYRQAGNAIHVGTLETIFLEMFNQEVDI